MPDFPAPNRIGPAQAQTKGAFDGTPHAGVRGWLLLLCLMLTVVGPLASAWLAADEYLQLAPHFAGSRGAQAASWGSIGITACSVALGIYAGFRLWSVRPGAVDTAKNALLFGLAADVLTTAIQLVFFTVCFAYLNKSTRVAGTYRQEVHGV